MGGGLIIFTKILTYRYDGKLRYKLFLLMKLKNPKVQNMTSTLAQSRQIRVQS